MHNSFLPPNRKIPTKVILTPIILFILFGVSYIFEPMNMMDEFKNYLNCSSQYLETNCEFSVFRNDSLNEIRYLESFYLDEKGQEHQNYVKQNITRFYMFIKLNDTMNTTIYHSHVGGKYPLKIFNTDCGPFGMCYLGPYENITRVNKCYIYNDKIVMKVNCGSRNDLHYKITFSLAIICLMSCIYTLSIILDY